MKPISPFSFQKEDCPTNGLIRIQNCRPGISLPTLQIIIGDQKPAAEIIESLSTSI